MKFPLAALRVVLVPLLALPGSIALAAYRCDDAGKIAYSDQPCVRGMQSQLGDLHKPEHAANSEALQQLDRERAKLHELQQQRAKREARYAKEERKQGQEQARKRKACRALERRKQWAAEDVVAASAKSAEAARRKARRAAEIFEEECGRR